ncbi:MAG: hypothetical protein KJ621_16480, partial [Proteobacteria bacterium]|nr:hypothetical protein [Pseudomonadota bacterium]
MILIELTPSRGAVDGAAPRADHHQPMTRGRAAMFKMSIHPAIQAAVVLAYLYVTWLGLHRFASRHLGKATGFNWKRHVRLGTIVLVVALLGAVGGLMVAKGFWYRYLATGLHGILGLIAVPLVLVGLVTGGYMNWKKRPRRVLPLVHG